VENHFQCTAVAYETDGGRGGRSGRPRGTYLSKGRHIEVSKNFGLSFSVQKNGTKEYKKLFPLIF